jgi:hypothetical protein
LEFFLLPLFGNVESFGTVLVHEKYISTCGDVDLAGFVCTYSSSSIWYSTRTCMEKEMLKLESCD